MSVQNRPIPVQLTVFVLMMLGPITVTVYQATSIILQLKNVIVGLSLLSLNLFIRTTGKILSQKVECNKHA